VLLLAAAYAANFEVPDLVRVATQVVFVAFGLLPMVHWAWVEP